MRTSTEKYFMGLTRMPNCQGCIIASFLLAPLSKQGILDPPSSLSEESIGFPKTFSVGANSVIVFPPAVGLHHFFSLVCGRAQQTLSSAGMPTKTCFLRLVPLPFSQFAYRHILAPLPTARKKEIIRTCASVQQSPKISKKADLFR